MKLVTKHKFEKEGILTDFRGGLNKTKPPFNIEDNQLVDATNWYYDPSTGYITTRPGTKKYSSAATPAASPINGIAKFISGSTVTVVITCEDGNLYKLDGTLAPVLIGALTGSKRPSFAQLDGKLVIASGGVLQTWDGVTLVNTTSPTMDYISQYAVRDVARIIGCGNSTFIDRVWLSGSNGPENWALNATEANAKYIDVGYKSGLDTIGVAVFKGDLFIFKRTIDKSETAIYRAIISGASTTWTCNQLTAYHGTLSEHFLKEGDNELLMMGIFGPSNIRTVDTSSDFPFAASTMAREIAGEIKLFLDSNGFTIYDPIRGVMMYKPSKNSDIFYCQSVYDGQWTYFRYNQNILCGIYVNGKMLFGASNGYVYEYDTSLWQDDEVSYIMSIESKWFNLFEMYEELMKDKELDILGIAAGQLTFRVKNRGVEIFSITRDFSEPWWTWTQVEAVTPANWIEGLTKEIYATIKNNDVVNGDYVNFQISVSSGLCSISQLRARTAATGRN